MSDQHFLIVHEDPDDGMDVEHPEGCPTDSTYDGRVLIHTCEVGRHIFAAGLESFFHRDVPDPYGRDDSEKVTPGRWPIETWGERTLERDEYRCVHCGDNRELQQHHRKPRKSGGRADWRKSNSPANLVTICLDSHEWIESRREEAYDAGWLVRENDDPAEIPVHHQIHGLVYLLDDGTVMPVPHVGGAA